MESLAYLVMALLLAQLLLGAVALLFAIMWRAKNKFARTSMVLLVLLALQTLWAFTIPSPVFAYIALVFLAASALVRFIPKN
jgi:nitrate reductase gamma subunit